MPQRTSRSRDTTTASLTANLAPIADRVQALKTQRTQVIRELHEVIASAQQMLVDLEEPVERPSSRRTPRPAGAKKKRRLSPEGRARIIAAAKKRWAKHRKAQRT